MRFIQSLLLVFVVFFPGIVQALGLGKIQLDSALNEPFEARIELLSATVEELDSLKIGLADDSAFNRAGIPRTAVLSDLRFTVKETEDGPDYVRVYSNEPIREPFLNFLLEISWSKGRLYREYTVLLDPPIYSGSEKQKRLAAPPEAGTTGQIVRGIEENNVYYNPDYQKSRGAKPTGGYRSPTSSQLSYSGGDYGPVVTGDTLWSIAKAMRPDTSVSIQQMMLALLRSNPEAFINNNINGLKRGFVLQMPDMSDVKSVSKDEAFANAKMQNELWQEARGAMATVVTPRPESTVTQPEEAAAKAEEPIVSETPAPAPAEVEAEPELRLVAPAEGGEVAGTGEQSTKALTQELALANETLEALKLENVELKDKLSETEVIVDDLKRLIVLKEEELAALQQKIAEQQAQAEAEKQKQAEMAAAKPEKEPAKKPAKATEQAPVETVSKEEKEAAPAEKASKQQPAEEEPVATGITSFIPSGLMGLVNQFKNNLPYSAAVPAGAILLILIISVVIQRRRSSSAVEIPQSAFPGFDDLEATEGPEDATDINPALDEEESESETILPGSEDETVAPDFEGEKTKVVAAKTKAPAPAPKAKPAAAEPEPDAFDLSAAAEEEEDPLAEVNVFLAYEHFDQAEEFVKQALAKEPDNLEFHNKLLEVYYAANNKKGYEAAARELHDKVDGQGEYWDMAVAMWNEISPNRELFAEATEEEEEATTTTGGGIVNIAGEGGAAASAALDFDLDTTAAGGDELLEETSAAEDEADVLDVTAAVDMEDDQVLDVTSASESDEGSMDLAFDMEESPKEEPAEEALDISLDTGSESPEESAKEEDNSLDFSLDMDATATREEPAEEALDISLDTGTEEASEAGGDMDFSLDFPSKEESAETAEEDNSLDISLDTGSEPSVEEDNSLDLSLDAPEASTEEAEKSSAEEEVSLDFSMDLETPAEEPAESKTEETNAGADLLDVTTALSMDEDDSEGKSKPGENIMDISEKAGGDLLDVTKSSEFELDNDEDLLDVTTSASSAGIDADDLLESEEESKEAAEPSVEIEEGGLDFELSPDEGAATEGEQELSFDGIDITAGSESAGQDLDFNIETGGGEESEEVDMDATMQIPSRRSALSLAEEEPADSKDSELVINEEDADDGEHTILVPRSSGTAEQSEADEIATQLDLAKAYVELGDKENARTILDEIIAIGNEEQKQQAQELLSQI